MTHAFLARLDQGPMQCDGAIGTVLYQRGATHGRCIDELNLGHADLVSGVHQDYLRAGAEFLTTNTWGANSRRLADFGVADRVREINLRGVKIAREAREIVGLPAFVAGAVGPVYRDGRGRMRPRENVTEVLREQIAALLEGGADCIYFETFADLDELEQAVDASRLACDLPVIASMTFGDDGLTPGGITPELVVARLNERGVEVIGVNCSVGPQAMLSVVTRLSAAGARYISAMPNAGLPVRHEDGFAYTSSPDYFAEYAIKFVEAGASLVGGCCGTSPEHVTAMSQALRAGGYGIPRPAPQTPMVVVTTPAAPNASAATPAEAPTELASALSRGDFVVSVEMAPPKGLNPEKVLAGAELLAAGGVKFVNVTDGAMARVRMNAIAVAALIQARTPLEVIVHYTTRDRNLMALQSELLGAHALGIRNMLALTGDPPSVGDYPDATGVWDIDSIGLLAAINRMKIGKDFRGREIGRGGAFCVGAAVNPTADDLDLELERFARKLDAGAEFLMSQPLYDIDGLNRFLDRVGELPVPLLLGVLPLQSAQHADFLHNEVPGIVIPDAARAAMHEAGPDGVKAGIDLAQNFVGEAQALVEGIYLMPSFVPL